jgi:hypothetical protein
MDKQKTQASIDFPWRIPGSTEEYYKILDAHETAKKQQKPEQVKGR